MPAADALRIRPATALPSPMPSPTVQFVASAMPERAAVKGVAIGWRTVTIPTYAYRQALRSDPASPAYPHPVLDRSRVGPPTPTTCETVTLELGPC